MSARAILNRVEPEINAIRNTVQDVQLYLNNTDERVRDITITEERLEDRVDLIEEKVKLLHEHLNTAIKRINDLHKQIDTFTDKDLHCYEDFDFSEISDEDEIELPKHEEDWNENDSVTQNGTA